VEPTDGGRARSAGVGSDDPGDITLRSYELAAVAYAERKQIPHPTVQSFLDRLIGLLAGKCVLELGSGPGIDADYLERGGVRVIRTDAAIAFVAMMRARGADAQRLDVRSDPLGGPYDAVVANAVLLHLSPSQLRDALRRLRPTVPDGGPLAFTVKEGDGSRWSSAKIGHPRHFTYWQEESLRALLRESGWTIETLEHVVGPAAGCT
jgi:SAM-dependent methyltransferase